MGYEHYAQLTFGIQGNDLEEFGLTEQLAKEAIIKYGSDKLKIASFWNEDQSDFGYVVYTDIYQNNGINSRYLGCSFPEMIDLPTKDDELECFVDRIKNSRRELENFCNWLFPVEEDEEDGWEDMPTIGWVLTSFYG